MKKILIEDEYKAFVTEIKAKVYQSQHQALRQVNRELIGLYWEIGRSIVERQEKHGWGKSIVVNLAKDLQNEFPGVNGFSVQNLWYMRKFYKRYEGERIQQSVGEIGWGHNIVIMEKCKNLEESQFYMEMTKKYGWTRAVLIHQIEGRSYQQYLKGQTNFDKTLPEKYRNQAKLAVKDEYSLEFLELTEKHNEKELELAIMMNMRHFLSEMGGDFAFIGNQFKLEVGGENFYVDILLYHRRLKALVALELKTGAFKPEYTGKMNFYLTVLNEKIKTEDEAASIGIIICKDKDRTIVEYALKDNVHPIGVASYRVMSVLPHAYKEYLPSPEVITGSVSNIMDVLAK
ncbi:MAG TPA: PDDEXK nuclease domain-containing protein [Puia sp.]|nr:PDDEXK nuclease domain-containing protein [Puia sp.]